MQLCLGWSNMDIKTLSLDLNAGVAIENGLRFSFNIYDSLRDATVVSLCNYRDPLLGFNSVPCVVYTNSNSIVVVILAGINRRYYVSPLNPTVLSTIDPG